MRIHDCLSAAFFMLGCSLTGAAAAKPPVTAEIVAAAESGDAAAQFQLARAYLRGEGVPKDVNKAFSLMKAAADQGHADAIGGLGYFYSAGIAVPKDPDLAAEWFRKGAEKGSAKAQLNLGKWLLDGKDQAPAACEKNRQLGLQWIQKAAGQNLPEATLSYGMILYYGDHGVAKDPEAAARYLKIAGDGGFADAQNILGVICEKGQGLPKDESAAREWYRKAALQGQARAQFNLGRTLSPFHDNRNTRIDAMAWLLLAVEQGDAVAVKTLDGWRPRLKRDELVAAAVRAKELSQQVSSPN